MACLLVGRAPLGDLGTTWGRPRSAVFTGPGDPGMGGLRRDRSQIVDGGRALLVLEAMRWRRHLDVDQLAAQRGEQAGLDGLAKILTPVNPAGGRQQGRQEGGG